MKLAQKLRKCQSDLQRYRGIARSLCAIRGRLSDENRKALFNDRGLVLGADGSCLLQDDWAYAIYLHRRVQIE